MAKELSTKFSIDLGDVVDNSISAVRTIRKTEQTRKEAEFQRAVANGLSYSEQIKMREAQLASENTSQFADPEYITTLTTSISNTKKLNRFNNYRMNYSSSLSELNSGKINEEQYLSVLQKQLVNVADPELRLEIQNDIVAAQTKVKTYKDTILSNQVKKVKYDGTKKTLDDVISSVSTARASALINDKQDDVTAYDATLSALNSQLAGVNIQDSITNFQVNSATRGTNPVEKLDYINSESGKADPNTPITIGNKSYASAQQFWTSERDNFLSGNSQVFGNFFSELDAHAKDIVSADSVRFGYPTQAVLDDTLKTFNNLRAKPEITPFLTQLSATQAGVMGKAVDELSKTINAYAANNLDFKGADAQLQNVATKYGVDVTGYRLQLQDYALKQANLDRNQGIVTPEAAAASVPEVATATPKFNTEKPTTAGTTPTTTITTPTVPPVAPAAPVVIPPTPVTPATTTPKAPVTPATPTPVTPAAPVAAVPPETTPKSTYTGSSIVDYLKSVGQDVSVASRAKLAVEKGVVKSEDEYLKAAGTNANATMNTQLLDALRKQQ